MRRAALALLVGAALCGLVAGTALAHKNLINSVLNLNYDSPDSGDVISGTIASGKSACVRGRPVTLFVQSGGSETAYARTNAASSGDFQFLPNEGKVFPDGTYIARVTRKVLLKNRRHRHICKPAHSPTVVVQAAPPGTASG
jgi:hypothetical protein